MTEEEPPSLTVEEDSYAGETYTDEDLHDVELLYNESTNEEETKEAPPANTPPINTTRSCRQVRVPVRYHDTINMLVGKMDFTMGHMHFAVAMNALSTPILVRRDELAVLGVVMMQLRLKESLRSISERGSEGAVQEMRHLHSMHTFFPCDPKAFTREE